MQHIEMYGWRKDKLDHRDHVFELPPHTTPSVLPPFADLRSKLPPCYDQGQLGSCTANGIAGAIEFLKPGFMGSRLMIYYDERVMEHTVQSDAGAEIRDGIKSVAKQGVCPENAWPYNIAKFKNKPKPACYKAALANRVTKYAAVIQNATQLKGTLAGGLPVVFGFSVFEAFESDVVARTGMVPMPNPGDAPIGGHCVLLVGYDDSNQVFICRNSWGPNWGVGGHFSMPYLYVTDADLASDFWVIQETQ